LGKEKRDSVKKFIVCLLKVLAVFTGWLALSHVADMYFEHTAVSRLFADLIVFVGVVLVSYVFWLIDHKSFKVVNIEEPFKNIFKGILIGAVWVGVPLVILFITGKARIVSVNHVDYFILWIISCFFSSVMQGLLIKGYIYQLIEHTYGFAAAVVVSTVLFTVMHHGVFEAGPMTILNIASSSVAFSFMLRYSETIILPITAHFVWNLLGGMVLGAESMAHGYPALLNIAFNESVLFDNAHKLEGSVLVLLINIVFILTLAILIHIKEHKTTAKAKV